MKQKQGKMIDGDRLIEKLRAEIARIMRKNARRRDLLGTISSRTIDALSVVIEMIKELQREAENEQRR